MKFKFGDYWDHSTIVASFGKVLEDIDWFEV